MSALYRVRQRIGGELVTFKEYDTIEAACLGVIDILISRPLAHVVVQKSKDGGQWFMCGEGWDVIVRKDLVANPWRRWRAYLFAKNVKNSGASPFDEPLGYGPTREAALSALQQKLLHLLPQEN